MVYREGRYQWSIGWSGTIGLSGGQVPMVYQEVRYKMVFQEVR